MGAKYSAQMMQHDPSTTTDMTIAATTEETPKSKETAAAETPESREYWRKINEHTEQETTPYLNAVKAGADDLDIYCGVCHLSTATKCVECGDPRLENQPRECLVTACRGRGCQLHIHCVTRWHKSHPLNAHICMICDGPLIAATPTPPAPTT